MRDTPSCQLLAGLPSELSDAKLIRAKAQLCLLRVRVYMCPTPRLNAQTVLCQQTMANSSDIGSELWVTGRARSH